MTQWYSPRKGGNKDETHIIVHTFICLFNHREELGVLPFGDISWVLLLVIPLQINNGLQLPPVNPATTDPCCTLHKVARVSATWLVTPWPVKEINFPHTSRRLYPHSQVAPLVSRRELTRKGGLTLFSYELPGTACAAAFFATRGQTVSFPDYCTCAEWPGNKIMP